MPPRHRSASSSTQPLNITANITTAFTDAQRTTASHPRATKLLLAAYTHSPKLFLSTFLQTLNRLLIIFSRHPPVERLITFVARFVSTASPETTATLCPTLLTYLSYHSAARAPAVRFRSLHLIATILYLLPPDADLPDKLLDTLQQSSLHRAHDRVPRVRAAAAGALCRLQTTAHPDDDPCTARLIHMLQADTSAAVRKASLQALALNVNTLPHALTRIRDTNADVRRAAFHTLAEKNVHPTTLPNTLLINTLRQGLNDRVPSVRDACRDKLLLGCWIDGACEGNIFQFIDVMGCLENESDVLNVLKVIFESPQYETLLNTLDIDINNLTRDDVLILRALQEAKRGDRGIDKFIDTTSTYATMLSYYAVDEFASKHLLELTKCLDMSDEAGRKALQHVIRTSFLTSDQVGHAIVPSAIGALRKTEGDEHALARICLEIVHDVTGMEATEVSREGEGREGEGEGEGEGEAEGEGKGEEEGEEEAKGKKKDNTEWMTLRALHICREALRNAPQSATSTSPTNVVYGNMLRTLVANTMSEVEEIRSCSLECIGLFSLLDKSGDEARNNAPLLVRACSEDVPTIQQLALKVLVDMLMLFDLTGADAAPSDSQAATTSSGSKTRSRRKSTAEKSQSVSDQCLSLLIDNLDHEATEFRTIVAKGLARLLFIRRITPTPNILSRLMIIFHLPTTEADIELRQYLSMFFPLFAMTSPAHRIALEDIFEQTIQVLLNAPKKSPMGKVPVLQVAQFIISLTTPPTSESGENVKEEDVGRPADMIHERLAEQVLHQIIDECHDDNLVDARLYVKIFSSFRLTWKPSNDDNMNILRKLLWTAANDCEDHRLKATLTKAAERIEDELEKSCEQVDDETKEPEEEATKTQAVTSGDEKESNEEDADVAITPSA